LQGQTLVSPEALQTALAGFTGRDLSLTQLQEAAWVIVQTYRKAGWLAHAIVPQQEIDAGVVTLRVIEARLGRVHIDFPQGKLPRERIQAMANAQLALGQPLNLQQLDRLLLLLDDMPGVVATASFAEGTQAGTTDVRLVLVKNQSYWERDAKGKALPFLDAINVDMIRNKQTAFMKFLSGDYAFFNGIDAQIKDDLLTRDGQLSPRYRNRFRHRRAVIAARIIHHNHAKARWHAPQHPAQGGRTVIGDRDNAKACQGKGSIQPFKPRNPAQMRSTCASVNSGYMGTLITSCAASAVSAQPAGPSGTRP
jgi:hypothetical protein